MNMRESVICAHDYLLGRWNKMGKYGYTETSADVAFNKMLLHEYSKEACLRIPARSRGSFGRKICGWCGEEFAKVDEYAEHVLAKHRKELKTIKKCRVEREDDGASHNLGGHFV